MSRLRADSGISLRSLSSILSDASSVDTAVHLDSLAPYFESFAPYIAGAGFAYLDHWNRQQLKRLQRQGMARGRSMSVPPTPPRTPKKRRVSFSGRSKGSGSRSRSRSLTRKSTTGGRSGIITNQQDFYQKKVSARKPRSVVRAKNFARKVEKALHFTDEAHHLLEACQSVGVFLPVTNTTQSVLISDAQLAERDFRIGVFGNDVAGIRRALNEVYNRVGHYTPSVSSTTTVTRPLQQDYNTYPFIVKSIKANMAIKNVQALSIILDIYECVNTSDINSDVYKTAYKTWDSIPGADGFLPGAASGTFGATPIEFTRTATGNAGATPYMMANFLRYWKVIKKTRVQLEQNELFNYEYAFIPKGKSFTVGDDISGTDGSRIKKGYAKDIIIVINPTYNDNTVANVNAINLQWTKEYFLRLPEYTGQKNLMMRYIYP